MSMCVSIEHRHFVNHLISLVCATHEHRGITNHSSMLGRSNSASVVGQLQVGALVGFLVDVFKVLGLVGFSLACTLLAHAVANGLNQETDGLVLFDQEVP